MKKSLWLLAGICALSACGEHKAKDNIDMASETVTSVITAASQAMAHETEQKPDILPVAIDPALVTSVDQQIQTLQKKLPYKQNGNELTSVIRHDRNVYYHYKVLDTKENSQNFDPVKAKKQLLENCQHNSTKRILSGGFNFIYLYTFTDHSQSSIELNAQDCH